MAPRSETIAAAHPGRLAFNADFAAVAIALTLALLIRLNVIPHIGW